MPWSFVQGAEARVDFYNWEGSSQNGFQSCGRKRKDGPTIATSLILTMQELLNALPAGADKRESM